MWMGFNCLLGRRLKCKYIQMVDGGDRSASAVKPGQPHEFTTTTTSTIAAVAAAKTPPL